MVALLSLDKTDFKAKSMIRKKTWVDTVPGDRHLKNCCMIWKRSTSQAHSDYSVGFRRTEPIGGNYREVGIDLVHWKEFSDC